MFGNDLSKDELKNSNLIVNETEIPDIDFIKNYEAEEETIIPNDTTAPFNPPKKTKNRQKSCKNKETIFQTKYINSSYSLIHAYKCMPKPKAKPEFKNKFKGHSYKIWLPVYSVPTKITKVYKKGKLYEAKNSFLELEKSAISDSIYNKKRKGIIWKFDFKCVCLSRKELSMDQKSVTTISDGDKIICKSSSCDTLMVFTQINYLKSPEWLTVSFEKFVYFSIKL